jgi:hypothetical protein
MTEKLLNNILLIIVLLLVANYLSGGTILDIVKKYYEKVLAFCSDKIEGFRAVEFQGRVMEGIKEYDSTTPEIVRDQDFKQIYQKRKNLLQDDPDMTKIYHFLQSLITINNHYELTASQTKPVTMSNKDKNDVSNFLIKHLNCGDFKFKNLVILDSIIYFENPRGKEIRPFRVNADVYINNVAIAKVTLHLEMFIRLDKTFQGPINNGFPTLTRIKLLKKDEILAPVVEVDSGHADYEELNASDNSLIPDSINFSTEEN